MNPRISRSIKSIGHSIFIISFLPIFDRFHCFTECPHIKTIAIFTKIIFCSCLTVCSAYAAEVHGLEILEENINDDQTNCTRFIVVTNQKVFLKHAQKISICLELPHESGSLYRLLSHFIYNDLNMTRIESRPIEGKNWEYRFFIDFEGNMADPAVKNAIRGLREESRNMRILGNY